VTLGRARSDANEVDRVAFVACGDRELAEDAVQSAWLVAWRRLRSLRDPEGVRPWLLAVTANEARQLLRRRHGPVVEIDVEVAGDARGDPATGDERIDLRRALAHPSPNDRTLLATHYAVDPASRLRWSRCVARSRHWDSCCNGGSRSRSPPGCIPECSTRRGRSTLAGPPSR